jgi:excisionase family DNA binding protein
MNVKEAAHALGVSKQTVYKLLADHKIEYLQVEGRKVIPPDSIEEYRRRNTVKADGIPQKKQGKSNMTLERYRELVSQI